MSVSLCALTIANVVCHGGLHAVAVKIRQIVFDFFKPTRVRLCVCVCVCVCVRERERERERKCV